jgi:hypothetical protein
MARIGGRPCLSEYRARRGDGRAGTRALCRFSSNTSPLTLLVTRDALRVPRPAPCCASQLLAPLSLDYAAPLSLKYDVPLSLLSKFLSLPAPSSPTFTFSQGAGEGKEERG